MKLKKSNIIKISLILVFIIILLIYIFILQKHIGRKHFAEKNMEIYEKNQEKVFNIEKIIVCSSANAVDRSKNKNLQDLSIYQYTDMAIYINNGEELSNKNTVKKLYIDNISIEGEDEQGKKTLNYKNTLNFGLKEDIETQKEKKDSIDFNIIYTNDQEKQADYNQPCFYTDCSNPITLEYLNYDILNGYKMEENNSVSFDGSILEKAGITVEKLNARVKFRINIINNQNEKFSCPINIKIPLKDIYQGTSMKAANTAEKEKYVFFCE